MNRKIIWSPSAEKDFELILEYLEFRWNKQIARRFIDKVDESIDLIVKDPNKLVF